MNMFLSNMPTKKNSVNSSLNFLPPPKDMNETINKYRQNCSKTRFSHQEQMTDVSKNLQRNSSYNENLKINGCLDNFQESVVICMNHQSKQAAYVVLGDSDSPMYYCQRCAILIASKGFNVEQMEKVMRNKSNMHCGNSKRASFSQYDKVKNNGKQNVNFQNLTLPQHQQTSTPKSQPTKLPISQEIIFELEHCWKTLKSSRQSNLNQIDMYINTLNENIDFLEDYYYVLHEHIEKQKNVQLKDILGKKQLLEQLRAEVSAFFVKGFAEVKKVKESLLKHGEIRLDSYQQAIQQAASHKFTLNFEAAIEEVSMVNANKQSTLHKIGQQITYLIKNFHLIDIKNSPVPSIQRNLMQNEDSKPISGINDFNLPQNISLKQLSNPYNPPIIPGIINVQSSVRSLQLSFDNSENESEPSPRKLNQREDSSNNFTLNHYINHQRGEESSTNLLMTSIDIN